MQKMYLNRNFSFLLLFYVLGIIIIAVNKYSCNISSSLCHIRNVHSGISKGAYLNCWHGFKNSQMELQSHFLNNFQVRLRFLCV